MPRALKLPVRREATSHDVKKRGRPSGSVKDPVERMLRQAGNPNHIVADFAEAIITWHRPRDKDYERAALRRALAAGDLEAADTISMRDTVDVLMPHERRRVSHKVAIRMAIEMWERMDGDVGGSTIERDGRMLILTSGKADAVKRPSEKTVAQILKDRRAR